MALAGGRAGRDRRCARSDPGGWSPARGAGARVWNRVRRRPRRPRSPPGRPRRRLPGRRRVPGPHGLALVLLRRLGPEHRPCEGGHDPRVGVARARLRHLLPPRDARVDRCRARGARRSLAGAGAREAPPRSARSSCPWASSPTRSPPAATSCASGASSSRRFRFLGLGLGALLGRTPSGARRFGPGLLAIVGGVAATFDVHPFPESVRRNFDVRHNQRSGAVKEARSELAQWRNMAARAQEWGRLGRGLRAHAPEGASLVYGAVGAVGYFSGLFIHDTNGLVTREVALLDAGPRLRSPGHDKMVPPTFFLKDRPSFLMAGVGPGTALAARDSGSGPWSCSDRPRSRARSSGWSRAPRRRAAVAGSWSHAATGSRRGWRRSAAVVRAAGAG